MSELTNTKRRLMREAYRRGQQSTKSLGQVAYEAYYGKDKAIFWRENHKSIRRQWARAALAVACALQLE